VLVLGVVCGAGVGVTVVPAGEANVNVFAAMSHVTSPKFGL
jgi:hypothetical protein